MKLITAIIQPEKFQDVKASLFKSGVTKMSVHTVRGCGQQAGYQESYRGAIVEINLLNKMQLDIAVNDEFLDATIDAIVKGARTGTIGDGKIFVRDLVDCIRIRTGERGSDAVG